MSDKPNNPPAFPVPEHRNAYGIIGATLGMTMRDYFAVRAPEMPDWWHRLEMERDRVRAERDDRFIRRDSLELECIWRFFYADAMLKARES